MRHLLPSLLLLLTLGCSGCNSLFSSAYGFKNSKSLTQQQIAKQAAKYAIPPENSFDLDPAFYFSYLKSFDTIQFAEQVKNHYQPLQAMYFDKQGRLQNFQINCYTGGFPNLNWNREGIFETFPPKPQAPPDSLVSFQTLSRFLKPVAAARPVPVSISDDYLVVVFWSRIMGRQSTRLIRTVQQNSSLAKNEKVNVIYVNNDNLLARFWK